MPDQIFISYRRDDAAYVTGHINDLLRKEFGDEAVFTDVDNIALGVDFRAVLDETVSQCQVLLAVIGSEWLTVRDHEGELRLQDPADFVRIEIESALKRNIPVIPLLVAGATMPTAEELPESLHGLAFRNGIRIRPAPDFGVDMARLIKNLRRHFDAAHPDDFIEAGFEADGDDKETAAADENATTADPLHILVDEDDRVRHRAELGIDRPPKRGGWGKRIGVLAAVAVVAAMVFAGLNNREELEELVPGSGPSTADIDAPAEPAETISPADTAEESVTDAEPANPAEEAVTTEESPPAVEADAAEEPATDEEPPLELAESAAEASAAVPVVDQPAEESPTETIEIVEEAAGEPAVPEPTPQPQASELIGEGVRLAARDEHAAAIERFDRALELDPDAAFVYRQRGASHQAIGNFDAAISDFSEAIRLNSGDVNAYYRRGVSYLASGDAAAAIGDFDAVIELDPEYTDAITRRAEAQAALDETQP